MSNWHPYNEMNRRTHKPNKFYTIHTYWTYFFFSFASHILISNHRIQSYEWILFDASSSSSSSSNVMWTILLFFSFSYFSKDAVFFVCFVSVCLFRLFISNLFRLSSSSSSSVDRNVYIVRKKKCPHSESMTMFSYGMIKWNNKQQQQRQRQQTMTMAWQVHFFSYIYF